MGTASSVVHSKKDAKVMDVNKNVLMLNFGDILEEDTAANILQKEINQNVIKDLLVLREVRRETSYVDVGPQRLRIVFISNIGEIENLAYLANVKKRFKDERCDEIVAVIGSDILSPYLHSYLEKARDIVDLLNVAGVDAINVGKYELDFTKEDQMRRIKESKFSWIISNLEATSSDAIGFEKYKLISIKKKGLTEFTNSI